MNANRYALFAEAAGKAGPLPFLVEAGRTRLTFDQLDAATGAYAHALAAAGAQPGDRVVAQVEKSVENVLLYLGALRAGLIYVPLNTAYTPAYYAEAVNHGRVGIGTNQ